MKCGWVTPQEQYCEDYKIEQYSYVVCLHHENMYVFTLYVYFQRNVYFIHNNSYFRYTRVGGHAHLGLAL